jgi:hypothetical protein
MAMHWAEGRQQQSRQQQRAMGLWVTMHRSALVGEYFTFKSSVRKLLQLAWSRQMVIAAQTIQGLHDCPPPLFTTAAGQGWEDALPASHD